MARFTVPLAFVVVILCSLSIPAGAATATRADVSITNVTVSPAQPAPGEQFTVSTTIRNPQNSEAYHVTAVAIRNAEGRLTEYARVDDPGTLPVGSSMTIPLTLSLGSEGTRSLRVHVYGRSASGATRELQYPLSVVVRKGGPQIVIDADETAVGVAAPVNVTVSNGETDAVRNLELRLEGEGFDTAETRRILATLGSGAERSFTLEPIARESGRHELSAVLQFTTSNGATRTVRATTAIDVAELREDVSVSARADATNGSAALAVRVQNFGNAPLEDLVISARDGGALISREGVGAIAPDTSRTVRLPVNGIDEAELDVVATYETGGRDGRAETTMNYTAHTGRLDLTGVSIERDGGHYRITGSASNIGLSGVDAAVVSVEPGEGVRPVAPSKEYFIGTVAASDFVTFDLTAQLDAAATEVPVRVTYLVDGERVERTVIVERGDVSPVRPDESGSGGSGGPLVPALVTLVVLAVLAGGVVLAWRRYDGGD